MKVFVTGGAGYIGSATSAYFLKAGHEVIVFDNLVRGHHESVPDGATFVKGDVGSRAMLDTAFDEYQPDAVVHFAAFIEAGESMERPGMYFQNNVCSTVILLEAMMAHDIKKIVFSSTAAVYASKNAALNETDPLGPSNVYGETKLMIEKAIQWYHEIYRLRYAILRYFNACGAMLNGKGEPVRGEAHFPESHLIPLALQVPLGMRDAIAIYGSDYPTPDGTCIRDYIHIEDLASAHVLALEALDERDAMIYNLGNGRGYSVQEVIDVARQATGQPIKSVEAPRRPGDAPVLVSSSEKINDELGWQPKHPELSDIISSAWAWHRTHPHGYKVGDR